MKTKLAYSLLLMSLLFIFTSCESELEKQQREARMEQQKIEWEVQKKHAAEELALKEENERKEKVVYDRYINNALRTGATPYDYCFGKNKSCSDNGCSQLKVRTPYNSDVMVTIKKGSSVVRHAYIHAASSYTFELPNGVYQPFFYYGKGWNPDKVMKETDCGTLKGGFVAEESFGKDSPQSLRNQSLEYELIIQTNGNFSTAPSDAGEAF